MLCAFSSHTLTLVSFPFFFFVLIFSFFNPSFLFSFLYHPSRFLAVFSFRRWLGTTWAHINRFESSFVVVCTKHYRTEKIIAKIKTFEESQEERAGSTSWFCYFPCHEYSDMPGYPLIGNFGGVGTDDKNFEMKTGHSSTNTDEMNLQRENHWRLKTVRQCLT